MIIVDDEVKGVTAQHGFQLRCVSLCNLNVNIRKLLLESGNKRRKHISGEQIAGSDRQASCFQSRKIVDIILDPLFDFKDFFRSFDVDFPDFRKLQRAGTAVKEWKANPLLDFFDAALKEGWLINRFCAAFEKLFSRYTS